MKKILLRGILVCLFLMPLHTNVIKVKAQDKAKADENGQVQEEQKGTTDTFAQNAQGAYVMEYSTQSVVYKKNENEKLYPASMTKMMSLILIYEALEDHIIGYDDMVNTSAYAASMGGSQIFLEENEQMSVEHMLKSICIASANDAMVAMAEKIAGSESAFVDKMNAKAKELKLTNTHFKNCTGLHDNDHYSCAKDMALISKALLDVGGNDLLKITSTYEDYIREDTDNKFWLVNTNKLIRQYDGVDGLKTGFTSEAGSCISVSAKRNNIRFIAVVMKEPTSKVRNAEITQLLDYSFTLFDQVLLYSKGKVIDTKKISDAKENKIKLLCEDDISIVYEKGKDVSIKSQEIEWLNRKLPYKKGDRVAKLKLELNDGSKVESYLICDKAVHPLNFIDIFIKGMHSIL